MVMGSVQITNATLTYDDVPVFAEIALHLPAGKWVGLLGPSGIGKSSLLRLLAGLLSNHEKAQATIHTENSAALNTQIAYMAQTDLLLPWLTTLENVLLNIQLQPHTRAEKIQARDKAKSLLEQVGLRDALHLFPQQLSGGMRQRAALVRTLMQDKSIILMDEPFSALDTITRYKLQNLSAELLRDKTVLFITHDPLEALRLANEIYIMCGKPATLKPIVQLTSPTPREINAPEIVALQATLFAELTNAAGELT